MQKRADIRRERQLQRSEIAFGFAKLLFGFSTAKIFLNPVLMSMNFNGGVAKILAQAIQF